MNCDIGTDVSRAARLLADGQVVAFPTETVYGLGANALDPLAVARVFAAKGRPHFDPLIVHVTTLDDVRSLTTDFPSNAETLAAAFWPGPLTLVLPKVEAVPDLVTAGLPSVGIRVPEHPLARQLIAQSGVPVAAPSANLFGHVSPTTAAHVAEQLGDRIAYILDGGPCRVGIESTVLQLSGDHPMLLRPGGICAEDLAALIGPLDVLAATSNPSTAPQSSPGQLDRHYAPRTPLRIVDELPAPTSNSTGLLTLKPVESHQRFARVETLSSTGCLTEAAANFYAALRRLDDAGLTGIIARPFPDEGLGHALNDRLRRAAAP